MDLITRIDQFVNLQIILINSLRETLGNRDWTYLLDVPREGTINAAGEEWMFFRHGTGIRFERESVVVDANRHLESEPGIFDVGRLVDYFSSIGDCVVVIEGTMHNFDHNSGPALLQRLINEGAIKQMVDLVGDIYILS